MTFFYGSIVFLIKKNDSFVIPSLNKKTVFFIILRIVRTFHCDLYEFEQTESANRASAEFSEKRRKEEAIVQKPAAVYDLIYLSMAATVSNIGLVNSSTHQQRS